MLERKYWVHREKYRPRKVKVLFVAESPPSSGSYFYFSRTNGKDHLFSETMRALGFWRVGKPMRKGWDKRDLLEKFMSRGCYVIDVCGTPVDKMGGRQRLSKVEQGLAPLVREIRRLDPERILVVKVSIYAKVRDAIVRAGLTKRLLNRIPIPFPSHGNQGKYRRCLNYYLR